MNKVARGWAVTDDLGIDVATVAATRRAAIVNWLGAGRNNNLPLLVRPFHTDEQIQAMWEQRSFNGARVEVIKIEIVEVGGHG